MIFVSSMPRASGRNRVSFSNAASSLMASSMGRISSLASIAASSGLAAWPALRGVASFVMTTLPASIFAGMPTFWSSPTMGPGPMGGPPVFTTMCSSSRRAA
jgi:hypothetical protein